MREQGEQSKEPQRRLSGGRSHKTKQINLFFGVGSKERVDLWVMGRSPSTAEPLASSKAFSFDSTQPPCFHFHQCCSAIRKTSLPFNLFSLLIHEANDWLKRVKWSGWLAWKPITFYSVIKENWRFSLWRRQSTINFTHSFNQSQNKNKIILFFFLIDFIQFTCWLNGVD